MAYRSSVQYFEGIQSFILELNKEGKIKAAEKIKECLEYINDNKDGWKMLYRKLLLVKQEYERQFTNDENIKIDEIIEAAKRVMCSL